MYLFLFVIVCSLAIIFFLFKRSQSDEASNKFEYPNRNRDASEFWLDTDFNECQMSPSSLVEQTRRHISQTARNQWFFMRSQIRNLQRILANSTANEHKLKWDKAFKYMLEHGSEYSRVIDLEVKKLARFDGWDEWRKKEDQQLRNIIRKRLIKLQNPSNCSEVPVLVCNLTNPFGFASGVHDILWCFIKAYSNHQRLVLETSQWHYAPNGWENLFQPLSKTCHDDIDELKKISPWPGANDNNARRILRTIPQDLGIRIIRLQGNPLAWWYGQFLWYLMRPNKQLKSFINTTLKRIKFSSEIVGIHVRRTDKVGTEAKAHPLEEYMEDAEEYFQSIELASMKSVKRRVYIATDEPSVLKECITKYPHYDCLYNPGSAEIASNMSTRYSNQSFLNLAMDIFALSLTDFIVCTMSSGVCRVAYELKFGMDGNSADVSDKVSSLDIPHHYAWLIPASRKAIYNHKSKSPREISFSRGDLLVHKNEYITLYAALKGKVLDGFIKMVNKIQNKEGFVPIYKTREMFQFTNLTDN